MTKHHCSLKITAAFLSLCLLSLGCGSLMSNKIFASPSPPFMDLSFQWQNLVLLTQRTSISKLLKPNFPSQAPETGANFSQDNSFLPVDKNKIKEREMKIWVQKGSVGQSNAAKQHHPLCTLLISPWCLSFQHRSRTLLGPSTAQCHGKQEVFAEHNCHVLIKHWEMPHWALLHACTHSSCRMGW